jgi:hypothetical protein
MLTYKDTRPWAKAIKAAVSSRTMPPWLADPKYGHFNNDRSLTQTDINTITDWVNEGAAEGEAKDAPAPIQWAPDGWQIQPDVTVELPAFPVPARGIIDWQNLAIAAPFKEDTWITSVAVLPGEPAVVHHMCFGFEKHHPSTIYNTYEWMSVPRDLEGIPTVAATVLPRASQGRADSGGEGVPASVQEGTVYTREAGSTEIKSHYGRPIIRPKTDFCYLPGLPYEDFRPLNAGLFVPAGSVHNKRIVSDR